MGKRGPKPKCDAHIPAMIEAYHAGQTLEAIGAAHGISRERVRQLLRRNNVSPAEGGVVVRRRASTTKRAARRDAISLERWGCCYAEYVAIRSHGGRLPWSSQKDKALERGIGWELSLKQWWDIWQASERWAERGRTAEGYCMCRYGDVGPYAVGNVYIGTLRANAREYARRRGEKKRLDWWRFCLANYVPDNSTPG